MSADNYVIVREYTDGWRWAQFAGDPDEEPDSAFKRSEVFENQLLAGRDAKEEIGYIEYGIDYEELASRYDPGLATFAEVLAAGYVKHAIDPVMGVIVEHVLSKTYWRGQKHIGLGGNEWQVRWLHVKSRVAKTVVWDLVENEGEWNEGETR